ncbi:MAG: tetratricopeptide repeat protein [Saprospiraceae bacterium]
MTLTYKSIFSGHLEFGNERSYEKVVKMFQHRVENYYRNEILLKEVEEVFNSESFSLHVPRLITMSPKKTWKNTVNLLEYVAQFAIAGSIHAWMIDDGKVLHNVLIEPQSDKAVVQAFLSGRQLVQDGKEADAMQALIRAIDQFARHALAYERRGYINYRLRNYKDAMYDFTKSININSRNPEAYLGRAKIRLMQEDLQGAIEDYSAGIKSSIPLQPIYWQMRRLKAEAHLQLKEYEKAIVELKFFTRRQFTPDNPNYTWRKKAYLDYGKALLEIGEFAESVKQLNNAVKIEAGREPNLEAEQFLYRGIALKKAGKKGFVKDWKEAAGLGSEQAQALLTKRR